MAVALEGSAGAAPVTLTDSYYGGLNSYNNGGVNNTTPSAAADIIGPAGVFDVLSAVVERTGVNGNTLQVTINTTYAGVPGTPAAQGTNYGALFFAPSWNVSGAAPYATDVYKPNQWTSAFVMNANGSGNLYSTGTIQTTNLSSNPNVVTSYTTNTGTIVMSNVNGNPISAPNSGNPGFFFRQGQAVQFNPANASAILDGTSLGGAWSASAANDAITFSIIDNHVLGDTFALSWAMTCANDVIQGLINLPVFQDPPSPVPLPAALPFFAVGAGVMGLVTWRRKKRAAKLAS